MSSDQITVLKVEEMYFNVVCVCHKCEGAVDIDEVLKKYSKDNPLILFKGRIDENGDYQMEEFK